MTVYNSMSDIAVVGCCCCSAWLGLGELCVFVTVSAREYRREFVLVCVAEYFSRSSYDIRFAIPSGRLAASLSRYTLWFKKKRANFGGL